MTTSLSYRPEVDGLRAIAVLLVMLFHAGIAPFSGGYIGVDVFFVISGYLISSIILHELDDGSFALRHFYERRIRRIMPALFAVLLVCIPVARWLLLPDAMVEFSDSIIATVFFVSNIFFYFQSDYFDTAAELKPLLHTWSLGVEEQYYIIFPLLLLMLTRCGKSIRIIVLITLFLLSLAYSQWKVNTQPTTAFYLIQSRMWELLLGVFTALMLKKQRPKVLPYLANAASILGLLMIGTSAVIYTQHSAFPGLYALLPTIGTALIIIFTNAHEQNVITRLLALRPLVVLGLLSYSAYLWHQPLFVFSRIYLRSEPNVAVIALLFVLTFALAYLSWKFVEQPFRRKNRLSSKRVGISACIVATLLIGIACHGHLSNGNVLGRYRQQDIESFIGNDTRTEQFWRLKRALRGRAFTEGKGKKILIIGDSNSADLINVMGAVDWDTEFQMSSATINVGCGAVYMASFIYEKYRSPRVRGECDKSDDLFAPKFQQLLGEADVVLIASYWTDWEVALMPGSMTNLIDTYGDKFYVFGTKTLDFDQRTLINLPLDERAGYHTAPRKKGMIINDKLSNMLGARFINPYNIGCPHGECLLFDENANLLTFDGFHLTEAGVRYYAQHMPELF